MIQKPELVCGLISTGRPPSRRLSGNTERRATPTSFSSGCRVGTRTMPAQRRRLTMPVSPHCCNFRKCISRPLEAFFLIFQSVKWKDTTGTSYKAVLLSGSPGVGKTTTAQVVCKVSCYSSRGAVGKHLGIVQCPGQLK